MTIDPTMLLNNNSTSTRQTGSQTLGKDDFLKLLVTQLKMQDPLEPMQDKEFISQMATFTSLEQTNNMTDLLKQFVQSQSTNFLSNQAQVIGKTISWTSINDDTSEATTHSGTVNAVTLKDGKLTYVTSDGTNVDPTSVFSIKNTNSSQDSTTTSNGVETV